MYMYQHIQEKNEHKTSLTESTCELHYMCFQYKTEQVWCIKDMSIFKSKTPSSLDY